MPETTRTAMEEILKRLVPRGRLILVVYYGHEGGEKNWIWLILLFQTATGNI